VLVCARPRPRVSSEGCAGQTGRLDIGRRAREQPGTNRQDKHHAAAAYAACAAATWMSVKCSAPRAQNEIIVRHEVARVE
jgi:hypothetical protein